MTPLGFINGDPVYTGDIVFHDGKPVEAHHSMKDFTSAAAATSHVPKNGERHNLTQIYNMLGVNEYTEALDEIGGLQTAHSALGAIFIALGVSSGDAAVQVISHLRAEIKSKTAANTRLSGQLDQALKERDHNCEMADSLANAISQYFCEDIGEHSNVNCPWKEALNTVEDASGKMFVAESVVLDVAAGVFEDALQRVSFSVTHGANIKELMADAFATLRRGQDLEKDLETESGIKNPAGFGHG